MSSIYKKGRDGYYYYQSYVFNPKSGKKDKRIFYALGTKDLAEARAKQNELDLKHEEKGFTKSKSLKFLKTIKTGLFTKSIIGAISIMVLSFYYFKSNNFKVHEEDSKSFDKVKVEEKINTEIKITKSSENTGIKQNDFLFQNTKEEIKTIPKPKIDKPEVIIPNYNVERLEKLSNAFEQGRIYVTINEKSSIDSQRLLCEYLLKRYDEFSNIVICLYANNRTGKDLARGVGQNFSIQEQKKSWLAMYTYNSVEGAYFDDDPSGYLINN